MDGDRASRLTLEEIIGPKLALDGADASDALAALSDSFQVGYVQRCASTADLRGLLEKSPQAFDMLSSVASQEPLQCLAEVARLLALLARWSGCLVDAEVAARRARALSRRLLAHLPGLRAQTGTGSPGDDPRQRCAASQDSFVTLALLLRLARDVWMRWEPCVGATPVEARVAATGGEVTERVAEAHGTHAFLVASGLGETIDDVRLQGQADRRRLAALPTTAYGGLAVRGPGGTRKRARPGTAPAAAATPPRPGAGAPPGRDDASPSSTAGASFAEAEEQEATAVEPAPVTASTILTIAMDAARVAMDAVVGVVPLGRGAPIYEENASSLLGAVLGLLTVPTSPAPDFASGCNAAATRARGMGSRLSFLADLATRPSHPDELPLLSEEATSRQLQEGARSKLRAQVLALAALAALRTGEKAAGAGKAGAGAAESPFRPRGEVTGVDGIVQDLGRRQKEAGTGGEAMTQAVWRQLEQAGAPGSQSPPYTVAPAWEARWERAVEAAYRHWAQDAGGSPQRWSAAEEGVQEDVEWGFATAPARAPDAGAVLRAFQGAVAWHVSLAGQPRSRALAAPWPVTGPAAPEEGAGEWQRVEALLAEVCLARIDPSTPLFNRLVTVATGRTGAVAAEAVGGQVLG